jgi:hypothetical protein
MYSEAISYVSLAFLAPLILFLGSQFGHSGLANNYVCWDQIAEGYLIPNTGEKTEGGIMHKRMESKKVLGA